MQNSASRVILLLTRFGKQARDHFSCYRIYLRGKMGSGQMPLLMNIKRIYSVKSSLIFCIWWSQSSINMYWMNRMIRYKFMFAIPVCARTGSVKRTADSLAGTGHQKAPRRPSDILVLSPSLSELEPLIRSVFAPATQRT